MSQAKKRINELILAEQAQKTISDPYINQLSQADMEVLNALQRKLTVSIRLDKGAEDQDPEIHLEGLTRDVFTAESAVRSAEPRLLTHTQKEIIFQECSVQVFFTFLLTIRDVIRKVERTENLKRQALLVSGLVEWQFQDTKGSKVTFDIYTNLKLEEALEKKQKVKIKINNDTYTADPQTLRAVSANRTKMKLFRKEVKGQPFVCTLTSCIYIYKRLSGEF